MDLICKYNDKNRKRIILIDFPEKKIMSTSTAYAENSLRLQKINLL